MCFQLYAALINELPLRKWEPEAMDLSVLLLSERETPIKLHFNNPTVQFIGSTSGCGCDFPHLMFQNGGWPSANDYEVDQEQDESDRKNREGLVRILQSSGDAMVELYGICDGNFEKAPESFENIPLDTILKPDFCFKERGFYRVHLNPK